MMVRAWWHGAALERFVADLVAGELSRLRPGTPQLPGQWGPEIALDTNGIGCDSLELLSIAAALSESIHLHETGIEDYLLARRTLGDWTSIAHAGLDRFSTSMTFRTSGSSGKPKPCTHLLAGLQQEVDALAGLVAGARRVLSAVPAHHIYGFLFTMLLPPLLGPGLTEVIDIRGHSPSRLAFLLQEGDLVVGHPAFWEAVARAVPRLPPKATGVTSTAPCAPDLATTLQRQGLGRLIEIYGSSETAGIGWRDDPAMPFQLLPHWCRAETPGMLLRKPAGDSVEESRAVPDSLDWVDAERFRPTGRRDAAVQVGGINVFPTRVRATLLDHPLVAEAAVRLMAPEEGSRLKAFIVPRAGTDPDTLRLELTQWVNARLQVPERPRAIAFGASLPMTQMGKPADWPAGL